MTEIESSGSITEQDRLVSQAQASYLGRCAPGYRTWRARWSGGSTQVIEVGEGSPLLLVHGGLGEAFQWGSVLAPLARHHRVLAIDRPGHGLADPFDYQGVDLLAHARLFLGEIMDAAELRSVPIVANSMGGLWSAAFALANPERVPRLVLVGCPAGIKRELPLGLRVGMLPVIKVLIRALMRRPTREGARSILKQLLVKYPEQIADDYLDLAVASQLRNVASWFTLIDRTVDFRGLREEFVLMQLWKELSIPTTMIWGEQDVFGSPEEGEAVAATNPRLRVVRVPDAGHAPWIDQPDRVVVAINEALGRSVG